jgi:hypothetical protein
MAIPISNKILKFMKRITPFLLTLVLVAFASTAMAQSPVPVLTSADIDKFVKTVGPMSKEFDALGPTESDEEFEQMLKTSQGMAIVKKYGWDVNTFSIKWIVISMAYAEIKIDEQLAMLPADQREMAKQMMQQATNMYAVSDADRKLIKNRYADLDKAFMALQGN